MAITQSTDVLQISSPDQVKNVVQCIDKEKTRSTYLKKKNNISSDIDNMVEITCFRDPSLTSVYPNDAGYRDNAYRGNHVIHDPDCCRMLYPRNLRNLRRRFYDKLNSFYSYTLIKNNE